MGKYEPLGQLLIGLPDNQHDVELTFGRIDGLVGGLPPSSRKLRTWWANNSQSQALAWRAAGWHVDSVDLAGRTVVFSRGQVGGTYAERGRTPLGSDASRGADLDQTTLPPVESVDARVVFEWHRLGSASLDAAGKIVFPRPLPADPGLYRFLLTAPDAQDRIYIGESDNLRRRLASNYRNPGPRQHTSLRVNGVLVEHLRAAGQVTIDIAVAASLTVADGSAVDVDLGRKAGRLLAESVALVLAQLTGDAAIENLG